MIKTFIDSGVLIFAARGQGELAEKALSILEDSEREFASSIFIKLEVLPKGIYLKKETETKFYQTYFSAVSYWATDLTKIIEYGFHEASNYGTGAMDSLHLASAKLLQVDEFVTKKRGKRGKFIHLTILLHSLHSSTPPLLHSSTPPLLHSSTPPLHHFPTPLLPHSSTSPLPTPYSPKYEVSLRNLKKRLQKVKSSVIINSD
jgi:predicted nucleic acid-binding protein